MSDDVKVTYRLKLHEVMERVKNNVEAEIAEAAEDAATLAKALAPKRTGAMAASIHVEKTDGRAILKENFPGAFNEFGTVHQPACPHMLPAALSAKKAVVTAAGEKGLV